MARRRVSAATGAATAALLLPLAAPTAAAAPLVTRFRASFQSTVVAVTWRVRAPARVTSFQLYRAKAAQGARRARVGPRLRGGRRTYRYLDASAPLRAILHYWLVAVLPSGMRVTYGPVAVVT